MQSIPGQTVNCITVSPFIYYGLNQTFAFKKVISCISFFFRKFLTDELKRPFYPVHKQRLFNKRKQHYPRRRDARRRTYWRGTCKNSAEDAQPARPYCRGNRNRKNQNHPGIVRTAL